MPARVLILEDDEDMRESLLEALEDRDYEVSGAATALDAIKLAGQRTFDLVVHDVRMAQMDGLEALDQIRTIQPLVKAIVITGYADDHAPTRALRQGAYDYIYKPFQLSALIKAMESALKSEELKEQNHGFMAKLSAGFATLRQRRTAKRWEALEDIRQSVYQAYFVGIRSRSLEQRNARVLWDLLDSLERMLQDPKDEHLDKLEHQYSYVLQVIRALEGRSTPLNIPCSDPVEPAVFARFYKRIEEGELSLHEVSMGAFLRNLDKVTLLQFKELGVLRDRVWG